MKRFLLWMDILGFDEAIETIAEFSQITDSSLVRRDFVRIIDERVAVASSKGYVTVKSREKDSWVLIVDSLTNVFRVIGCVADHTTSYRNLQKVPLEIGIGVEDYEDVHKLSQDNFLFLKPTIRFLKTHITDYYRKEYRQTHNGQPPSETFVVLTDAFFKSLAPLDREFCEGIQYSNIKSDGSKEIEIFYNANLERICERSKVYDFLECVGKPGSKSYDRIDELYVPPKEYKEIESLLQEKQIVFITGTAEYGKTYTAVRLLWEYFTKGYKPIWVEGGSQRQREQVGKRLEDIGSELQPRSVIYFEDPFGKTTYECRESLEREIGTIIEEVHNIKNVFVIITSREEAFKEFEKAKLSIQTIREFERKLNIRRPSYGYSERFDMLVGWAKSKECKWLENSNLKKFVLDMIKNDQMLPTPLSIKDFTIATANVTDEKKLIIKIREKSTETSKSFAREIMEMPDDRLLFISIPFITALPIDLAKKAYDVLVNETTLRRPLSFYEVLEWFKDDKIVISSGRIEFSHPSYFEAFEIFFKESLNKNLEQNILGKALIRFSEIDESSWDVGSIAEKYFDKLPVSLRNDLLLRLSKRPKTSVTVAWLLANNFFKISKSLRSTLLSILLEKNGAQRPLAWAIRYNFEAFNGNLKRVLAKLSENDEASWDVACIIKAYFDKLPTNFRNELISKLVIRPKSSKIVIRIIANHYEDLPPEIGDILLSLAECEKTARAVSWAIGTNFYRIPECTREKLLLHLSKKREAFSNLIWILSDHSSELPTDLVTSVLANCNIAQRRT